MLAPKRLKRRKPHRPKKVSSRATRMTFLAFGSFGLKALTGGWVTSQQLEAARRVITRYTKKGGKIWIRAFPDRVITNKGSQTTMGGGKGVLDHYVAAVRPGTVMFELDGISLDQAKEAMELAAYKLPVRSKFIIKD